MGRYLNPLPSGFQMARNSRIFVDKSGLISCMNSVVSTMQRFVCVSRPRRFGKSMAADMLSAYYAYGQDNSDLFSGLEISRMACFREHLNKYDVIKVNMQTFLSASACVEDMISRVQRFVALELTMEYPKALYFDKSDFEQVMQDCFAHTHRPFVILIDEWDCIFREYKNDSAAQTKYLDFLRMWLKDKDYTALAYITGILPIKKYGTHSALNMFTEYSMTNPRELAPYFGFTAEEVHNLCAVHNMSSEEAEAWYDGYELSETTTGKPVIYSIYNPKSIVESLLSRSFDTYWNQTETYEALKSYIRLNMRGLKDSVIKMLAGEQVPIDTEGFENDMVTFACADDVLTLLVHLGYLTYHRASHTVSIPNKEVAREYVTSILRIDDWSEVARSIGESHKLLNALWNIDGAAVAAGIDRAHNEISILEYNDENSLACTVNLAFYSAREYYSMIREMPTGKGFADICLLPRRIHADKPAVIIELKYDKSAQGAVAQIYNRQYVEAFKDYKGSLLLVGINYDKKTKKHSCVITQAQI